MMEQLITHLLYLHIAAGTLALITGPLSMANRKGSRQHRKTGKLFFAAMMVVSVTAVFVAASPVKSDPFLLIVGVFSAYLVLTGYRILYLKDLSKGHKAPQLDWGISTVMLVFSIYFIYSGITGIMKDRSGSNDIVSIVFGSIALLLVIKDLRNYTAGPIDKDFWLYDHITRMIAGNIAAFTAFLVVNNTVLPPVVAWLAPTVIGTCIISYNIRKYKMKARGGKAAKEQTVVKINVVD